MIRPRRPGNRGGEARGARVRVSDPPPRTLTAATLLLAAALALAGHSQSSLPEQRFQDALNRALPLLADSRLVLIAVDDATLSAQGPPTSWSPWVYVRALQVLQTQGARVVGVRLPLDDAARSALRRQARTGKTRLVLSAPPAGEPADESYPPDPDGRVRSYRLLDGPDSSGQTGTPTWLARLIQAGAPGRLSGTLEPGRRLIRSFSPRVEAAGAFSLRDLLSGQIEPRQVQGKTVLIGVTALPERTGVRDAQGRPTPLAVMDVRALTTQLHAPLWTVPAWTTAILGVLAAYLALRAPGAWGFLVAGLAPLLAAPLWHAGWNLPGLGVSLAALLGTLSVAGTRWWRVRQLIYTDPYTGLGNLLALRRLLDARWRRPHQVTGLILLGLDRPRQTGAPRREAEDQAVQALTARLNNQRGPDDRIFRINRNEVALLLPRPDPARFDQLTEGLRTSLNAVTDPASAPGVSVGGALSSQVSAPAELLERAGRARQRDRYARQDRR